MVKEEKLCGSTCTKIILLYCRFERDITKNMFGLRTEKSFSPLGTQLYLADSTKKNVLY